MNYGQFVNAVLTMIALLLGLYVFNAVIISYAQVAMPHEWILLYLSYVMWIGKLIFGIIMFMLMGRDWKARISISVLAVMTPYFGALFYLLVSTVKKEDK